MKIQIAEDDKTSRLLLDTTLSRWGHEVVSTKDGQQAYNALLEKDGPKLAILESMMPYLGGIRDLSQSPLRIYDPTSLYRYAYNS